MITIAFNWSRIPNLNLHPRIKKLGIRADLTVKLPEYKKQLSQIGVETPFEIMIENEVAEILVVLCQP